MCHPPPPGPTGAVYKSSRKHLDFNLNLQGHLVGVVQLWLVNNNLGGSKVPQSGLLRAQWDYRLIGNLFGIISKRSRLEPEGRFRSTRRGPANSKWSFDEKASTFGRIRPSAPCPPAPPPRPGNRIKPVTGSRCGEAASPLALRCQRGARKSASSRS